MLPPGNLETLNGALLINKHPDVSSFGIIDLLQKHLSKKYGLKRSQLPKLGHGGTLDPFATGLLVVCVGRAVKLARYFLGSTKMYEGVIRFGETTVPGDPTAPISETSEIIPESLEELQALAHKLTLQPYLQVPPMHSAKKKDGKPLYELARAGIEIEREPKLCQLHEFEILSYEKPRATFRLRCGSGTYVRSLAQDFAKMMGSVALLESLCRTGSGHFRLQNALPLSQILEPQEPWNELPCWMPFDRLLEGYPSATATEEEAQDLFKGRQNALFNILKRAQAAPDEMHSDHLAVYCHNRLVAVACRENHAWRLERVFTP
ncbi:MAG: tRNA pseudouridine(55) synthase TruB [Bdellovibrionales bacterium RIFOXYD1_FULL_55_31]|nr:MAG: tRNA pseudouridine(55) synthase TruB [Bdellovibrionales bacterium RIFOXYD1_FULL_55_31]